MSEHTDTPGGHSGTALPAEARPADDARLADGIAAELSLARGLLTDLGLKEWQ